MNHVVYWYGAREESSFYGFVAHKDLVTYQEGIDRGYYKVYEAVRAKAAENKKLTKGEQDKLLAINEVNEDLRKKSDERKRGVADFPEAWELLSLEDLESSSDEESVDDGGNEEEDDEEDDDPQPQLYARKKSYHDSHRLNGRKFVQSMPQKHPTSAFASAVDQRERPAMEGSCHIYEPECRPPDASVQSLGPDSTDGTCTSRASSCSLHLSLTRVLVDMQNGSASG